VTWPERLFRLASDDVCCNTSYPISPDYFTAYRAHDCDIMAGVSSLAFYIHVPFCNSLCRFCEYTRVRSGKEAQESRYVDLLERQIEGWRAAHPYSLVHGLDVGGGTPTALNPRDFARVMKMAAELFREGRAFDFEPSVEFSYDTITAEKMSAIGDAGFTRASTGLQVVDKRFLSEMGRASPALERMQLVNAGLKAAGVVKLNLDIMYGFAGQAGKSFEATLHALEILKPEQVTLYEVRYNMNALAHAGVTREPNYTLYSHLYDGLVSMGYRARFGQNTFSRADDEGVSSYLRHRMFDGIPYKGFGISAQSMSPVGLAYNSLKNYSGECLPEIAEIVEKDVYRLPGEELAAKYVAVALYGGRFKLSVITDFLGANARAHFASELDFLVSGGYLSIDDLGECRVTRKGFWEYGAIAALFWSDAHKRRWLAGKGVK
jgi:oxygen-independent coproporphyrinogen-3 oxidase